MKIKILFAALAAFFISGCSLFKSVDYQTSDGIALSEIKFADFSYDEEKREIILSSVNNLLRMNYGRRIAEFNGIKVWLFHPPLADSNGVIRICKTDIEKIIRPLFHRDFSVKNIKRIVLDPGHGGHDKGAVGRISVEKDLNLSLALKIKKELEKNGFEVFMTRSDDTFLTLDERCDFAREKQADIFISIHHNSATVESANGIEIFSLPPAGVDSSHENGGKATPALPGNKFDNENIILSYLIYSSIMQKVSAVDRGMKFARYRVLANAPCPAVLLEAGFISNIQEEKNLNNSDIHDKISLTFLSR